MPIDPISDSELDAMERRYQALPHDHWERGGPYPSVSVITMIDGGSGWPEPEPPSYELVCQIHCGGPDYDKPPPQVSVDTAEFIAHARQDVPRLVAEVRTLRAEVERLRSRLVNLHRQKCTSDNCVLDGGPEHEEAFEQLRQRLAKHGEI